MFCVCGGEDAAVAVGAHSSGVGTGISVADSLVVLRGFERNNIFSVAQCDEADFFTFEELFDHQARTERSNGGLRLGAILRDDHAFTCRQPVRFDDNRGVELGESGHARIHRLHASVASGGNAKASHELLGVDLAPFQLRRIARRPHDFPLGGAELVDHAGHQGNFRSDDSEVGIDGVRRSQVVRGRQKLAEFRDPGIARRAVDLMTFLRQAPGDGVLAAAAADNENLHRENCQFTAAS